MPELPEVETVKRTLSRLVVGKRIEKVYVGLARIIWQPTEPLEFSMLLEGQMIHGIRRFGKYLLFDFDDMVMISHLRMEGKYGLYARDEAAEPHTHVYFHFDDGTDLRYRDVRQFGTMEVVPKGQEWTRTSLHKLGPEPLDAEFGLEQWKRIFSGRRGKMKPLLLNQHIIAGIGNIYADEILFRARIHPEREATTINDDEHVALYHAMRNILQEAVDQGGTTVKSYVNGQGEMGYFQQELAVYGRSGEQCLSCQHEIIRSVVGGRGTHTCPSCQRL